MSVLKGIIALAKVLALPRFNSQYIIDTDEFDTQAGCVLQLEQKNKSLNPIGYWSPSLCDAEARYDISYKECSAVVWAVLLLSPYLKGSHFIIKENHQALRSILDLKDSTGRMA